MKTKNKNMKTNAVSVKDFFTAFDIGKIIFKVSIIVVLISFITFLSIAMFTQIGNFNNAIKETNDYSLKSSKLQNDLKNNIKTANKIYVAEKIQNIFSDTDIHLFTHNLWKYGLYVNDEIIKNTSSIKINVGDRIIFKEIQKKSQFPEIIVYKGSFTGGDSKDSISNHLFVKGKTYSIVTEKNKNEINNIVEVNNLKSGDKFQIVISDQLASKMISKVKNIYVTVN